MNKIQAILGLFVLLGFTWLISTDRKNAKPSIAVFGVITQIIIALLILYVPIFKVIFKFLTSLVNMLQEATQEGTQFVFGYLGGGQTPFEVTTGKEGFLFIFAFRALPLILVASALTSLFFYWRIIPFLIKIISKLFEKTLGIGGALGLSASSSIFFGLDIAPLIIRPHLKYLSRSELFSLLTCAMATVSSSVIILYVQILKDLLPGEDILGHILTASVLNIVSALTVSRLMIPHVGHTTSGSFSYHEDTKSSMDALSRGVTDVINVMFSIASMLIVLTSIVYLINKILFLIPYTGGDPLTLQSICGYIFSPVMWLMGIPISEAINAGEVMGVKTVLNEIFAYQNLVKAQDLFSVHTRTILVYAICGFANFSSVGIAIGALGSLVPERRHEIVSLGLKSVLSGTIATCITGTIIGLLT